MRAGCAAYVEEGARWREDGWAGGKGQEQGEGCCFVEMCLCLLPSTSDVQQTSLQHELIYLVVSSRRSRSRDLPKRASCPKRQEAMGRWVSGHATSGRRSGGRRKQRRGEAEGRMYSTRYLKLEPGSLAGGSPPHAPPCPSMPPMPAHLSLVQHLAPAGCCVRGELPHPL